jgi:bacterioferritin-associated ferredoxin
MAVFIDRCVCFDVRFAELKEMAERTGARSVPELQEHIEFGRNCHLCHPYVRLMLQSGLTVFREIVRESNSEAS